MFHILPVMTNIAILKSFGGAHVQDVILHDVEEPHLLILFPLR